MAYPGFRKYILISERGARTPACRIETLLDARVETRNGFHEIAHLGKPLVQFDAATRPRDH
jgi:hypothetical protein